MSTEPTRITWIKSKYGSLRGEIGEIEVAVISPSTTRGDDSSHLRMTLPGFLSDRTAESEQAAQDLAERILKAFVKSIGAQFAEAKP